MKKSTKEIDRKGRDTADTPANPTSDWEFMEVIREAYILKLYIAGLTPKSVAAINNLRRICDEHLQGRFRIEIIDLLQQPALARKDQILAVPTLVKNLPPPLVRIIGDLSDTEQVLIGLNIQPFRLNR